MDATAESKVRSSFFFGLQLRPFLAELASVMVALPEEFVPVFQAFRKNIEGVVWLAGMPFLYVGSGVRKRHLDRIYLGEKFASDLVGPDQEEDRIAREATAKFREHVSSPEGKAALADATARELLESLKVDGVARAASEVLRQSEVLVWGAFEVLAGDVFVGLLNSEPRLAARLLADESTRRRFQARDLLSLLQAFGFDLSYRMGEALRQFYRLDDPGTIGAVFEVLMPGDPDLRSHVKSEGLWKLYQRRNLIVHRRGTVDDAYLRATGEQLQVGSELAVSPARLEEDLALVRDAGVALSRSLNARFSGPR